MQVAYLLNIRGNDVAHCPVAMAYALVTSEGASLFIDRAKLSPNVEQEIKARLRRSGACTAIRFFVIYVSPGIISLIACKVFHKRLIAP